MAKSLNKVMLIGNLGADPEMRKTNSGMAVGNLRLAVSDQKKDKDGNWNDHTEWISVTVFDKLADNCEKFLHKGSKCFVEGKMQTRKWQDKDGNDRYTTEVLAFNVQFLDPPKPKADNQSQGNSNNSGSDGPPPYSDDEIPF